MGPDGPLDGEVDAAVRRVALEFLGDPGDLGAEIDLLRVYLGPRDAGKLQQVVDKRRLPLAGGLDPLSVAPVLPRRDRPRTLLAGPC